MTDPVTVNHVSLIHAIILGIVQGSTEFLPVSSTAHMRVLPALLHWSDPGTAFSAVVQLGPIFAIIYYFRAKIGAYFAGMARSIRAGKLFPEGDKEAKLGWFVAFGTIPLIIAGLALEKKVDGEYRNLYLVGGALILLGLALAYAEKIGRRTRAMESLTFGEAMLVGISQAFALVPGASRSGCTITAGMFLGLTREDAADFSFLLSIPAITLAGLYKLTKVIKAPGMGHELPSYLIGSLVAGIVAYVVIKLFLGFLKDDSNTTWPFIWYRVGLGVVLIGLAYFNVIRASDIPVRSQPASAPSVQVRTQPRFQGFLGHNPAQIELNIKA